MVIVMAAAAAAAAGLSVAKIRDRTVSLALLDPEGFRIFWVLKVFVSFGSRRFLYLLDLEGFRIFPAIFCFRLSDSKGNVVVSDTQKPFFFAARSPPANPQTSRQPSIDPKSKKYY